jgi:hypothetical protein
MKRAASRFVRLLLMAGLCSGCIVIQTVPERRAEPQVTPTARIILEQRQAQPVLRK